MLLKLNAFSIAVADLIFVLESKCAYLSVVLELECPSQSCISLKDIPFLTSNVEQLCLRKSERSDNLNREILFFSNHSYSEGKYNYNAFLLADENTVSIKLVRYLSTYAKIEYFGRKEQEKIDSKALKEAVINAIVHNDYSYGNSPIIELYSDRIEITSAGVCHKNYHKKNF